MIALALAGLRCAAARRTLLAAAGVLAASLVVGTGATVGYGLATGFERAADQAGLPDVIARFDPESRDDARRARARAAEPRGALVPVRAHERRAVGRAATTTTAARCTCVMGGRRGYLIVDGRDLSGRPGEVVIERGLAREWDLSVGDRLARRAAGERRAVVGIAVSPDNVAYPARARARGCTLPGIAAAGQRGAAVAQRPRRRPT